MEYLIPCKPIGSYQSVSILSKDYEEMGTIEFNKTKDYDVRVSTTDYEPLLIQSNALKRNNRFVVRNEKNETLATVRVGVKIIHSIIERDKYYFVKASFWKMYYTLYDNRTAIGTLQLIRHNKKRYFKITVQDDFVFVVALFLLAHAVRIKSLMS